MFLIKINLDFDSAKQSKTFFNSIKPELDEEFNRSSTRVSQKQSTLLVELSASDKTALRASLNSIMKPLILFNQLEEL